MPPSDITGITPIDSMHGEDGHETALLKAAYRHAHAYMMSQKWCVGLGECYFGAGLGGVATVFLVEISPLPDGIDQWLWTIVGDIPPAYLVTGDCKTPFQALEAYIELMMEWVTLARIGESSDEVIPVNVPANPENAEILEKRLNCLKDFIFPWLREGVTVK